VEAIPNVFNLAEQLIFTSIIFYEEISNLYTLFTSGLRCYTAFNL
jgi:hypothetical protein